MPSIGPHEKKDFFLTFSRRDSPAERSCFLMSLRRKSIALHGMLIPRGHNTFSFPGFFCDCEWLLLLCNREQTYRIRIGLSSSLSLSLSLPLSLSLSHISGLHTVFTATKCSPERECMALMYTVSRLYSQLFSQLVPIHGAWWTGTHT